MSDSGRLDSQVPYLSALNGLLIRKRVCWEDGICIVGGKAEAEDVDAVAAAEAHTFLCDFQSCF